MKFHKVVRSQDKKVQTDPHTAVLAVYIGTSTKFLSSILSMKLYGRYSTQSLTIRSPIATIVTVLQHERKCSLAILLTFPIALTHYRYLSLHCVSNIGGSVAPSLCSPLSY